MADGDQLQRGMPVAGGVSTSGTTPAYVCGYTPPNDCCALLWAVVVGQCPDAGLDCIGKVIWAIVNTTSGGTVAIQDQTAPTDMSIDPNTNGWTAVFEINDSAAKVKVTGGSGQDVEWSANIQAVRMEASL
jgi:hypothetical protein